MEVAFRLVLHQPTPAVDFGLQSGSGSKYSTVQCKRSSGKNLQFNFILKVKGDSKKDLSPKFSGPFVQGPANNKFIYLGIGTYAGQNDSEWSRRMKISLIGIGWSEIEKIKSNPHLLLEAIVPGRRPDGTPNFATVKPYEGWAVRSRD
jgi:hypothetical protein